MIHLNEVVEKLDCVVVHRFRPVKRNEALNRLEVSSVVVDKFAQDIDRFGGFTLAFVKRGKHTHSLDSFRVVLPRYF